MLATVLRHYQQFDVVDIDCIEFSGDGKIERQERALQVILEVIQLCALAASPVPHKQDPLMGVHIVLQPPLQPSAWVLAACGADIHIPCVQLVDLNRLLAEVSADFAELGGDHRIKFNQESLKT